MIIKGGRVVTEVGVVDADILVVDGSIESIGSDFSGGPVVDARGAWVLPGVVDPHVHTSVGGFHTIDPLAEDLKQGSVILASFAYHAAMRDEPFPHADGMNNGRRWHK